jgi:hypothetical protein
MGALFSAAREAVGWVLRKHSTLALCCQTIGEPTPGVKVGACCSVGTEDLPELRHRLLLFGLVSSMTLSLSAAVRLGIESRFEAFVAACGLVFPASLLVRSYLANYSLWVAQSSCGVCVSVRLEEWALLGLVGFVLYWLSVHSSQHEAIETLTVAGHTWLTMQFAEALFLFLMHWVCSCCGCCYVLGFRKRPTHPGAPAGSDHLPGPKGDRQASIEME